jgi:UDP-N-acetylmuramate dehydrogenase
LPTTHSSSFFEVPSGFSGLILKHENLNRHTSLRVGGAADCMFIPHSLEDIQLLLRYAHRENIPTYLLGGGTNLLVSDAGVRGWVIKLDRFMGDVKRNGNRIVAGAGTILSKLVKKTISCGLCGLENLYGIPGTVGGAVAQNAGAFGSVVSDCLVSITLVDKTGELVKYSKKELDFSYRSGPLRIDNQVIVDATFQLEPGDRKSLEQTIKTIAKERKKKFPAKNPTAGCFFKNDPQNPAGKLIDQAGLKGCQIGGAMVSEVHANFIINTGSATAADIYELMNLVREKVHDRFGVLLEPEVKLWPGPSPVPST